MRLITRNDTSLSVALIAAAVILFRQPLRHVLDLAQKIESRYQLDLVPALLLLVVALAFHEYRKYVLAHTQALAATADAALARTQSRTFEKLMIFSQALANALDRLSVQQVLGLHLPAFAGDRTFWVLVRSGDHWEVLLQDAAAGLRPVDQLKRLATRAVSPDPPAVEPGASESGDVQDACFPLLAGGTIVGVMGIGGARPIAREEHHVLSATAALIAIGIKNMQLFLEMRELTLRDGLTGCFNKEHGLQALDVELRRAKRSGSPLTILMFDIDHFKTVNDRFGHLTGDELLGTVGTRLGAVMRSSDMRCRYGGDEFLVILPDTPLLGAQKVAEGLRQEIANLGILVSGTAIPITISIGVAVAAPGETDAKALITRADEALYGAKTDGRNRVRLAIGHRSASYTPNLPPSKVISVAASLAPRSLAS